ncbi:MAG: MazG nucleotide pyrophosphohydrolase domain-containing protein [archaeon]
MKLKEIADKAKEIEDEIGLSVDDILNKLTQELGEFNDAVQKFRGRYCRKKGDLESVKEEVGDLFFNLISVCSRLGISVDELPSYAQRTLYKFQKRREDYKKSKEE